MTASRKITISTALLGVIALAYLGVKTDHFKKTARNELIRDNVWKVEKGIPGTPSDFRSLAGRYSQGQALGDSLDLLIYSDGTYAATFRGCSWTYGESFGIWKLMGNQIIFNPTKESPQVVSLLCDLEVLMFKRRWILVNADKAHRDRYDKWGVREDSCLQLVNRR